MPADLAAAPLGATLDDAGAAFRVWAPHATAVAVALSADRDGTGWDGDPRPLAPLGDGTWAAHVPGVAAGHRYKFVLATAAGELWRNDPRARQVTHSAGDSVVCDTAFDWGPTDATWRTPPWDDLVVYELHAGTFNDEPGGRPGGFASVEHRLGHLVGLGVNCIELMPSAEFAADFSWGYNPAHIYAIESAYGGPAGLKSLVRAAHEHGIAVLLDVVYNHFGPSDLDLWQFDGWHEHGKGGIYFYNDGRSQTPWGDTRPDYGREEVRRFIADNARLWLDEFRIDGLRWDMTAFIRNTYGNDGEPGHDIAEGWRLMQLVNDEADRRHPGKLQVAEDLQDNAWVTRPTGEGGAGFDSQWDSGFVHPVRAVMTAVSDGGRSMDALRRAIDRPHYGDPLRRVIYTESHDEVANGKARLPEEVTPGDAGGYYARKRSTLGAAIVFTSPGIPMLFQGQELLEDEWFRDAVPLDWTRAESYAGVLLLYRDLVHLRRDLRGTTRGLRGRHVHAHHVNDDDNVLAWHRWDAGGPGDDVVVVANVSDRTWDDYRIGLPRPGRWRVRLNSDWAGYGADYGNHGGHDVDAAAPARDGMAYSAAVAIGRYSVLVLSQDRP